MADEFHYGVVERLGARPLHRYRLKFFSNKNGNSMGASGGGVATPETAGPEGRLDAILPDRRGTAEMAHLFHIGIHNVNLHKLSMLGGIVTPPQHFVSRLLTATHSLATLPAIRPPGATGPAGPEHRPFSRRARRLETHPREGGRGRPGRCQVRGKGVVRSGDCPWLAPGERRSLLSRDGHWRGAFPWGALNDSDRPGLMPAPETGAIRR